jgi:hypothetical protein
VDAVLVTRSLPLATVDALSFWHWIDAEDDVNNTAWDGGVIEASIDGGAWTQVTPDGGYPYTIIANPDSPFAPDTPCYSGTFDWAPVRVDLTGLSGSQARLRFRFGTDGFVTQEGWHLDDFTIEGTIPAGVDDAAGAATALWLASPSPNPARGAAAIRFARPSEAAATVAIYDVAGRRVRAWSFEGIAGIGESAGELEGEVLWDGRSDRGSRVANGIYFVRLSAGERKLTRRLVWMD